MSRQSLSVSVFFGFFCFLSSINGWSYTILTTTGMIGDIARNIAKEKAVVQVLMGPGVDPHLYKATMGDLEKIQKADLVLYNGLHLEGKMADILLKLSRKKPVYAIADRLPEERLRKPKEFQGQWDPHVWFDVDLWSYAMENALKKMIEVFPQDTAWFEENANTYRKQLSELHRWCKDAIQTIPEKSRVLLTAHDAFGYFGVAYGIEVKGLQGISTASEFGIQDVTTLARLVKDRGIKAIFVESSVSDRSIKALQEGVRGLGGQVEIGGTLYSDAMGAEGSEAGTYLGMVRHNVNTIVKALK